MRYFIAVVALTGILTESVFAHCQIPCGIYDDPARFIEMKEHITTIEKSMNQIKTLKSDSPTESNQIVRWVNNKETHADKLTEIVTAYFLTQRIKPSATRYEEKLKTLHSIMLTAMKARAFNDLIAV